MTVLILSFLLLICGTPLVESFKDSQFYAEKGIAFVPYEGELSRLEGFQSARIKRFSFALAEAKDSMSVFKTKSTTDFRPIRIDLERKQILIGAR